MFLTSGLMRARLAIIISLIFLTQVLNAQLTYDNLYVDYDSAIVYKNLKVIPVRWKGKARPAEPLLSNIISLGEALEKGLVRISERGSASTENVHWLILENLSKKNIY